jgi:competence protein ComEA
MIRTLVTMLALTSVFAIAAHAAPLRGQGKTPPAPKATVASTAAPGAVVNINTATAADFEGLPGIGAKTAARIVEYRQKNGPFKKIEELMNIRGLGEKNFLKLKAQLSIGNPKTTEQ